LKKSTLFTISAVIVFAMTVFYTTQLSSIAGTTCNAYESFELELEMTADCIGGDLLFFRLYESHCEAKSCVGTYNAECWTPTRHIIIWRDWIDSTNSECNGW